MKPLISGQRRHLAGWKPDRPDHRDVVFRNDAITLIPSAVDHSQWIGRIDDQGDLGSCTANASTGAMEVLYRKAGLTDPQLSRLFVYFTSRVLIERGQANDDSGCQIRDVMKALATYGACSENIWPYDVDRFSIFPSDVAFEAAKVHRILRYNSCPTLNSVKTCLALGYPIVFGFSVPASMMSETTAMTGIVLYPTANEGFAGGHAVMGIGYDDTFAVPGEVNPGAMLCVNSWGAAWGLGGLFHLPYRYFETGLADDAWALRREGM